MFKYLGLTSRYPVFYTIGEIWYYGIITAAVIIFLILGARRLHYWVGYPKNKVFWFSVALFAGLVPVVYTGSRAAGMLNRPFADWGFELLIETIVSANSHTFHGAMISALVYTAVVCRLFKLKISSTMDTIFLYLPFIHALGRTGCLVVGCCWGTHVNLYLYGFRLGIQNPVPLYAIMVNLAVFLFLRRIYERIYSTSELHRGFKGSVIAAYLLLYPPARIVFEVFRTEPRIFHKLTQAQIIMGFLFCAGLILTAFIWYKNRKTKPDDPDQGAWAKSNGRKQLGRLFAMAVLTASLVVISFVIYYFTRQLKIWPWPIRPVLSLSEAYVRILWYLPVMLVPVYALAWTGLLKVPLKPWLFWNKFSNTFWIGLAVSIYYCLELLVLRDNCLRGPAFWPPVVIMSVMNAAAEEIIYRFALYNIIKNAAYKTAVANIVQALVYSLIHFMIAGAVFGILSFIFGLILGMIAERNKSLIPAFICHFIIDLGVIGMPMLRC
jgi:phosphatidylglycerol:prolipoprotein diacylglycerol transferase